MFAPNSFLTNMLKCVIINFVNGKFVEKNITNFSDAIIEPWANWSINLVVDIILN